MKRLLSEQSGQRPRNCPKSRVAAGLLVLALLSSGGGAMAADCNELLRLGYSNVSSATSRHDALVSAYHQFCQERYSSASSAQQQQIAAAFSFLRENLDSSTGFGFDLGFGSSASSMNAAYDSSCTQDNVLSQYVNFDQQVSSQISDTALSAWEKCLDLNLSGLQVDIRRTANDRAVSIDLWYSKGVAPAFIGIDQPDTGKAKCVVSRQGAKSAKVGPNTVVPLGAQPITLTCRRKFASDQITGNLVSPATRLVVKTGAGSFDVDFVELALKPETFPVLADLYTRINALTSKIRLQYVVGTEQTLTNLSNTIVNFDSKRFDNSGAVKTGSAWSFTAPRAGKYLVTATVRIIKLDGAAGAELNLLVNGKPRHLLTNTGSVVANVHVPFLYEMPTGVSVVSLLKGDIVQISAYMSAGGDYPTAPVSSENEALSYVNIDEL